MDDGYGYDYCGCCYYWYCCCCCCADDGDAGDYSRIVETHSRRTSIGPGFCNWRWRDNRKVNSTGHLIRQWSIYSPSARVLVIVVVWQGIPFGAVLADIGTGGAGTHQHAGGASSCAFYAPESCGRGQRGTLFSDDRSKESCALLLLEEKRGTRDREW